MIESDFNFPVFPLTSLYTPQPYQQLDKKSQRNQEYDSCRKKAHNNLRQNQISRVIQQVRLKYFLHQLLFRITRQRCKAEQVITILSKAQIYDPAALLSQYCFRFFVQQIHNLSELNNLYILRFLSKNRFVKQFIVKQQCVNGILNIASKLKNLSEYLAVLQQILIMSLQLSHQNKTRPAFTNSISLIESFCMEILQRQKNDHILTKACKIVWLASKKVDFSSKFNQKLLKLRPKSRIQSEYLVFYSLKKSNIRSVKNPDTISLLLWFLNRNNQNECNNQLKSFTLIYLRHIVKNLKQALLNAQLFSLLLEFRNMNRIIPSWYTQLIKKSVIPTKEAGDEIISSLAIQFIQYKVKFGIISQGYKNVLFLNFLSSQKFNRSNVKIEEKVKQILSFLEHFRQKSLKFKLISIRVEEIINKLSQL